ncbi:hypothetical protein EDB80DRAFT_593132 [Ilyonectria destructans]|nr:hypothetical protein EDB80DRAFT_593132 [Ilyonectria destructans]
MLLYLYELGQYTSVAPSTFSSLRQNEVLYRKVTRRSGLGKGIEADVTGCDPNILDTISKIFDTLMGEEGLPPSWQSYLLELEGQLRMRILEPLDSDIVPGTTSWMHAVTMLHCLTTVLWINRSVRGYCGTHSLQDLTMEMLTCVKFWRRNPLMSQLSSDYRIMFAFVCPHNRPQAQTPEGSDP